MSLEQTTTTTQCEPEPAPTPKADPATETELADKYVCVLCIYNCYFVLFYALSSLYLFYTF